MNADARVTYHHGDLRTELLARAIKILDAEGVDAVTIRAVARAAGVSHAAPVNHFPSRNALLTAVAAELFRQLAARIDGRLVHAKARDRARAFAQGLLDFGLEFPNRYRLMWRRDLLLPDTDLQSTMDGIYDRLIAELECWPEDRAVSAHTVAIALWSLTHGYVGMRIEDGFEERVDETTGQPRFEAMLDLLLCGAQ